MVNWAEESKRKDIDKLLQIAHNETDPVKKAYILQVIDKTRRNLEAENISDIVTPRTTNSIFLDLLDENLNYQRYYGMISAFLTIFDDYEMPTQTNLDTISKIDLKKYERRLSDEEAFTLVHDFYLNTDEIFRTLFSKYINKKYTTIKFSKDEPLLENFDCDGLNFCVDILMKNYILIRDIDGYRKANLLSHEFGHALSFLYEPKALYTYQDTFLNEAASLFFEFAFNYEVIMKQSGIIGAEYSISTLENITADAELLLLHDPLLDIWKNNGNKANNEFYRKIKEEMGLTRRIVNGSIHTSINEEGVYVFSYILSIYLLKIYKQDKKEAFRLLREMLDNYKEDSFIVLNSIMPNIIEIKSEIEDINYTVAKEAQKILK